MPIGEIAASLALCEMGSQVAAANTEFQVVSVVAYIHKNHKGVTACYGGHFASVNMFQEVFRAMGRQEPLSSSLSTPLSASALSFMLLLMALFGDLSPAW